VVDLGCWFQEGRIDDCSFGSEEEELMMMMIMMLLLLFNLSMLVLLEF